MTRRRWIADEYSNDRAALTGAHAAHLSRTLRARVGQEFDVACDDRVRRATVTSVSADRVEFSLGQEVAASAVVPITLLLAIFRFDRMEWAIEKCTELNVTTIIPVIAREASEQSRRASPPEIREPVKLKEALGFKGDLENFVGLARYNELEQDQPRRGGIGLSPGREPWVKQEIE